MLAQILHTADPGNGNIILFRQSREGLGQGGIGIFGQKHLAGVAFLQRLSELLCADDHLAAGGHGGNAARTLGSTMRFHTSIHYTHKF